MLSLRNFEDLFGRFVRVLRQHEMNRGVKSKKITGTVGNKSCHDFHYRGAILSPEKNDVLNHGNRGTISGGVPRFGKIMVRFYELWRDFRRVQNCLFKLKSVPNTRVTILGDLKCDFET